MAPPVSNTAANPTACFKVSAFEPTDVAKALAASLEPIPIDAINANIPPVIGIHKYILII